MIRYEYYDEEIEAKVRQQEELRRGKLFLEKDWPSLYEEYISACSGYDFGLAWNNSYHASDYWLVVLPGDHTTYDYLPLLEKRKKEGDKELINRWELSRKRE